MELIFYVIGIIGKWMINKKVGKKGWYALIPFYSDYLIFDYADHANIYFIILALNIVRVVFNNFGFTFAVYLLYILAMVIEYKPYDQLSKNFNAGKGMTWLLLLLGGIGYLVLGAGGYEYKADSIQDADYDMFNSNSIEESEEQD